MPFGLQNAPGTFQRTMDSILSAVKLQFALVYLNKTVFFSKYPEKHILHVRSVLRLPMIAGTTLQYEQVRFIAETIDYLEHINRPIRLQNTSHKINAIFKQQKLTSLTKLSSFLGLRNVFQRIVLNPVNRRRRNNQSAGFFTYDGTYLST